MVTATPTNRAIPTSRSEDGSGTVANRPPPPSVPDILAGDAIFPGCPSASDSLGDLPNAPADMGSARVARSITALQDAHRFRICIIIVFASIFVNNCVASV